MVCRCFGIGIPSILVSTLWHFVNVSQLMSHRLCSRIMAQHLPAHICRLLYRCDFFVMAMTLLRRFHLAYDASILRAAHAHEQVHHPDALREDNTPPATTPDPDQSQIWPLEHDRDTFALALRNGKGGLMAPSTVRRVARPNCPQQLIRATMHTMEFAAAYFIMLLAMSFNGYIIFCIFIGAFLGYFVFDWDIRQE